MKILHFLLLNAEFVTESNVFSASYIAVSAKTKVVEIATIYDAREKLGQSDSNRHSSAVKVLCLTAWPYPSNG